MSGFPGRKSFAFRLQKKKLGDPFEELVFVRYGRVCGVVLSDDGMRVIEEYLPDETSWGLMVA